MICHCLTSAQNCWVRKVNSQLGAFHSSLKRESDGREREREIQAWERGERPRRRGGGICGKWIEGQRFLSKDKLISPIIISGETADTKNYLRQREMKIIEITKHGDHGSGKRLF